MTTPSVPGYSLQLAQREIADLRGTIAHLLANATFLDLTVDTAFTAPDGSIWTSSGLNGLAQIAFGPNNQSVSSTSYIALTGMSIPVISGINYLFRVRVMLKANANAGQWLIELTGPATSTLSYAFKYESAAGVSALNANESSFGLDLGGPATSVLGFYWATIEGQLTPTANGNLAVLGKTTVGADTFNVFASSYLEVIPV